MLVRVVVDKLMNNVSAAMSSSVFWWRGTWREVGGREEKAVVVPPFNIFLVKRKVAQIRRK